MAVFGLAVLIPIKQSILLTLEQSIACHAKNFLSEEVKEKLAAQHEEDQSKEVATQH